MKRLRKKKKRVINDEGETMSEESIEKINKLMADVAEQAMKVGAEIYPEDEFLLFLASEGADSIGNAIEVPEDYIARMYTLWSEDFVGHVGDKVHLTKKGVYVVEILKLKLRGDPRWKKYM